MLFRVKPISDKCTIAPPLKIIKMKDSILENGYPHEEVLARKTFCAPQRSLVEPCAGPFSVYKYERLTEILNAKVGKNAVFLVFFGEIPSLPR